VEVDEETDRLFSMCQELHFLTQGAFDPTALPLIRLWNWQARPPSLPDDDAVRRAMELVGWRKVQCRPGAIRLSREGMGLDLGGIGKEYAVDRVVQFAHEFGLHNVLVDFGQDIRATGRPQGRSAWHVGLQDPGEPAKCWTGVAVQDRAVATSGGYLRRFELNGRHFSHILDPRTGQPVTNNCQAVSVTATTCTFAGALCTSAFILGEQEGFRLLETCHGAEGCILTTTSRYQTRRFNEHLTH
jgi:thiamine biosynthesis lipoprotein